MHSQSSEISHHSLLAHVCIIILYTHILLAHCCLYHGSHPFIFPSVTTHEHELFLFIHWFLLLFTRCSILIGRCMSDRWWNQAIETKGDETGDWRERYLLWEIYLQRGRVISWWERKRIVSSEICTAALITRRLLSSSESKKKCKSLLLERSIHTNGNANLSLCLSYSLPKC